MMNNMKKITLVIAVLTVAFIAFALAGCGSEEKAEAEAVGTCTITIPDFCEEQQMDVHEGDTVFDILEATEVPIAAEDTGDGMLIEGINGKAQEGMNGWLFYVNGEMPMDYCDKIQVNDGDVIVWEYSDGM